MSANFPRAGLAALILVLATAAPAQAYLDPGTGSILLQALIGAAAAGMVVGRGYLARVRAWIKVVSAPFTRNGRAPSE